MHNCRWLHYVQIELKFVDQTRRGMPGIRVRGYNISLPPAANANAANLSGLRSPVDFGSSFHAGVGSDIDHGQTRSRLTEGFCDDSIIER
jgi:hypothetical protein